jgi:general secretion pathway protein D
VRVENDDPYTKTYQASFLNLVRTNKADISTSNKGIVSASGSGGGSSGGSSGSETSVEAKNGGDGDLWAAIEKELSSMSRDVPTGKALAANDTFLTLNRQVGAITVKTTAKNHERIEQYLEKVRDFYSAQVLIEAKVVEVSLTDEFRSGIDWAFLSKERAGRVLAIDTSFPTLDKSFAKLSLTQGGDLSAVVDLVQAFGTTRTLSSPRITAMNNQQALLSFATNENYFKLTCDVTDAEVDSNGKETKPAKISVSSTLQSIPIGVILSLQPSIDTKNSEISMNIRPTLSRLTGKSVTDPAITICAANAVAIGIDPDQLDAIADDSTIPQVDVREMDSNIRLKNGEVMAIGGMIDQKDENTDAGVPWASEIPLIGNAFKNVTKDTSAVQTVIFLKATIVPGYGVDKHDKRFYDKFNTDPRPFKFCSELGGEECSQK